MCYKMLGQFHSDFDFRMLALWFLSHFVFVLPGSPGACKDGWDGIIAQQFDYRHMPCNFVEIMPRLDEHLKRNA